MEQLSSQYTALPNPYISQQQQYTRPASSFPQLSRQDAQQLAAQIAPHLMLKNKVLDNPMKFYWNASSFKQQPLLFLGIVISVAATVIAPLLGRYSILKNKVASKLILGGILGGYVLAFVGLLKNIVSPSKNYKKMVDSIFEITSK